MLELPIYLNFGFILTTLLGVFLFYKLTRHSIKALIFLIAWLTIQGVISYLGFYTVIDAMPPRFLLNLGPVFIAILYFFFTKHGKCIIDYLDLKYLTWFHIVRIPVELCLFGLMTYKLVPELMTFEGRNFDILGGITAPIIYYLVFVKKIMGRNGLLVWNILGLGLILFIIFNGVLSSPLPFQQFAFDQPNVALLHFPFSWLPGFLAPMVLISHLVAIRRLLLYPEQTFDEKES